MRKNSNHLDKAMTYGKTWIAHRINILCIMAVGFIFIYHILRYDLTDYSMLNAFF